MKFMTEDENDIKWMNDCSGYDAENTIRAIKDAGKWDEFLAVHQDENGIVDCDALYDYIRYESDSALLDVGLHNTESEHSVEEVLKAWEDANDPLKVSRLENGMPSGVSIYRYSDGSFSLDFESVDESGEVESQSLYDDDVFDLVGDNNSTKGEWDCCDPDTAVFECWRDRD